jgi:hypothetical protein
MINKYKPVLEVLILSLIAFVLHKTILFFTVSTLIEQGFRYSLPILYLFFVMCSLLIVLVLIKMKEKNIDSVGQTFLLLTSIKMVVAYVLLHPILQSTNQLLTAEKVNFFITFALFLTIETVVTIRILNKKQ